MREEFIELRTTAETVLPVVNFGKKPYNVVDITRLTNRLAMGIPEANMDMIGELFIEVVMNFHHNSVVESLCSVH